jgi:hypothetical protein
MMTAHPFTDHVAIIRAAVDAVDQREPMPALDRIVLWQDLRAVAAELAVVVRDTEGDATDALVEYLRDTGEDHLETIAGPVHVAYTSPNERWEGHRLIGALARTVVPVDPDTGELHTQAIRAVPVDVLRDTVAGCATDDATSSRWRKTGVRKYVDPGAFYDRDDPQPVIRAGVKP